MQTAHFTCHDHIRINISVKSRQKSQTSQICVCSHKHNKTSQMIATVHYLKVSSIHLQLFKPNVLHGKQYKVIKQCWQCETHRTIMKHAGYSAFLSNCIITLGKQQIETQLFLTPPSPVLVVMVCEDAQKPIRCSLRSSALGIKAGLLMSHILSAYTQSFKHA